MLSLKTYNIKKISYYKLQLYNITFIIEFNYINF